MSAAAPFAGIQMDPQSMLDEGVEHALDLIQETAAINCVMCYSHTYHSTLDKPLSMLAPDHGVPPRDRSTRKLPAVWVRHHEEYFRDTSVGHQIVDDTFDHHDRDVLAEAAEPCRRRGMKLYARILEGNGRYASSVIRNFERVAARDIDGRPTRVACWNHPEYRAFWAGTVEDLFRTYDLDGLQWGAERQGPLMNTVYLSRTGHVPFCFCEHCVARGRDRGVDPERARTGYERLHAYMEGLNEGGPGSADGIFTGFLRILLRHPEILAWEYQFRLAREEVQQAIYRTVKGIRPEAEVGWHVNHQPSTWDLAYRAQLSYADMAPYSDFIKFIAYHDVLGPRIRYWYLDPMQKGILGELSLERSLDLYYALFGYDPAVEPALEELATTGFTPDYVYRETARSVASAEDRTKIYPGIGLDVPWGSEPFPPTSDPDGLREAVVRAFDAGAAGIVASREYEEMRVPSLRGIGAGVREVAARA